MATPRVIRVFVVALTALSAAVSAATGAVPTWRCEDGRPCPLTSGVMPAHEARREALCEKHGASASGATGHDCCKAKAAAVQARRAVMSAPPMRCVLVPSGAVPYVQPRLAGDMRLDPHVALPAAFDAFAWLAVVPPLRCGGEVDSRVLRPVGWSVAVCRGPRAPPVG